MLAQLIPYVRLSTSPCSILLAKKMVKTLAFTLALITLAQLAQSSSIPFYKDVMKNFTKEELTTIKEFMTIHQKPLDPTDFSSKFECGDSACSMCASLKLQGQKREVCVKEYNRKNKPAGLTALYVDGKQVHEFVQINKYCQRLWGKVSGCLSGYNRAPAAGRSCYKMDINLIYTLVTIDFNCAQHEGDHIKLDTSVPHQTGAGILDVDLFGGKQPVVTVNQKDAETVFLVTKAAEELLKKLDKV